MADLVARHAGRRIMFRFRDLIERHTDRDRRAAHRRARQGAVRRHRRGQPRARGRRVRLRHPAAAQGRVLRERRRPMSTSTRSASRSAWSPASRRSTSRRWCRCGCSRSPSPAATRSCSSRARRTRRAAVLVAELLGRGRAARRRAQRGPRRQGGGRPAARASRRHGAQLRRARRRSPATSTRPATANGKRVQALGGAKNHMVVLPDADMDLAADAAVSRRLRVGGGAVHGGLGAWSRWATAGDELIGRMKERIAALRIGTGHRPRRPRWARSSPASTATGWPATSTPASDEGATVAVDGRDLGSTGRGRLLLGHRACSTTSPRT